MSNNIQSEVVINKRSIRVAFFLPLDASDKLLNQIFEYCHATWGGRYFPIIPTDGNFISDEHKAILEFYDPDIIESFVTLSEDLLFEIDRKLNPYEISYVKEPDKWWHPHHRGLGICPTQKIYNEKFHGLGKFVFWKLGKDVDPLVEKFVRRNFSTQERKISIPEEKTEVCDVTTLEDLIECLTRLGGINASIYQPQISSLTKDIPKVKNQGGIPNRFYFVVGNSVEDLAFFQNRNINNDEWLRGYFRQVWTPPEFLENESFVVAVRDWAERITSGIGNGSNLDLRFASFSLDQKTIEEKCQRLLPEWRTHKPVYHAKIDVPEFNYAGEVPEEKYFITGSEGKIFLNSDNALPSGNMHPEYFMADIHAQYRPDLYTNHVNRKLWWEFPLRNPIVEPFFGTRGRIRRDRVPSIFMKAGDTEIKIKIPNELAVFKTLFFSNVPHNPPRDDQRISIWKDRVQHQIEISTNGRYLWRFVESFGGINSCSNIFEKHFWRKYFDEISYKNDIEKLALDLEDIIKNGGLIENEIPIATKKLIKQKAKQIADGKYGQKTIQKSEIQNLVNQEIKEFDANYPREKTKEAHQEVFNQIKWFVSREILHLGITTLCPRCQYKNWFSIDGIQQNVICSGCGFDFPFPTEESWKYKFNTALQRSYQKGILPVIHILGKYIDGQCLFSTFMPDSNRGGARILNGAESEMGLSSFYWVPPCDLQRDEENETDLDILSVVNGKLVMGEVKESQSLFLENECEVIRNICDLAEAILPDIVIFSASDKSLPEKKIWEEIEKQKKRLKPLCINVIWESAPPRIFLPTIHFF
jgi:hypothetical protein